MNSVEIVPISRDSIVCLPRKLSHQLGGINSICLVYKITNFIHLIDVSSGQSRHNFLKFDILILIWLSKIFKFLIYEILFICLVAELNASLYWRHAFNSICDPKQLIEYTVMDIEQIKFKDRKFFPGQGTISDKVYIK